MIDVLRIWAWGEPNRSVPWIETVLLGPTFGHALYATQQAEDTEAKPRSMSSVRSALGKVYAPRQQMLIDPVPQLSPWTERRQRRRRVLGSDAQETKPSHLQPRLSQR